MSASARHFLLPFLAQVTVLQSFPSKFLTPEGLLSLQSLLAGKTSPGSLTGLVFYLQDSALHEALVTSLTRQAICVRRQLLDLRLRP